MKTVGLAAELSAALAGFGERVSVAFVYGSVASGGERSMSDVDLMVIGEVSLAEVASALSDASERIGREVNATVFSRVEIQNRISNKDRFFRVVLERPKLFVIGSSDDIR